MPGKPCRLDDAVQSRFPVLAFDVDDLDKAVDQLKLYGVPLPWGVEADSDSRWVMFYDPGGNLLKIARLGINQRHTQH